MIKFFKIYNGYRSQGQVTEVKEQEITCNSSSFILKMNLETGDMVARGKRKGSIVREKLAQYFFKNKEQYKDFEVCSDLIREMFNKRGWGRYNSLDQDQEVY